MAITLDGPLYVLEGDIALYSIKQVLGDLAAGASITFDLSTGLPGTATAGADYYAVTSSNFTSDIVGLAFTVNVVAGVATVTVTNNTGAAIASGTSLVRVNLLTIADPFLSGDTVAVSINPASSTTQIVNFAVSTDISSVIRRSISASEWEALAGDTRRYAGITGLSPSLTVDVRTGDRSNTVLLDDGIAFASLDTGAGNDIISILVQPVSDRLFNPDNNVLDYVQFGHGAYKAVISAGAGNDVVNVQSAGNSGNLDYTRIGPQDPPAYTRPDYYDSIVDAGLGDDYVYAFLPYNSQFLGGDGIDTLFFYGRFSDWSYELVDVDGGGLDITLGNDAADQSVWTVGGNISSTARQNVVRGFEFIQFNDILLDVRQPLSFTGSASVAEGSTAAYRIALAGDGLQSGQTVTFTLKLTAATALKDLDFATLAASALQASNGVTVQVLNVDSTAGTINAIATANRNFNAGDTIATVSIATVQDLVSEGDETYSFSLGGFINEQPITTMISDNDAAAITLSGPETVVEGASTGIYSVALSGVGLGAGRSVTLTLKSSSGTATEGLDYSALAATNLAAATGVALSGISTDPNGVITATATNSSGTDLATGSALLSFTIPTTDDVLVEGSEAYTVTLGSNNAALVNPNVTTTISDNDAVAITLKGPSSVVEGSRTRAYNVALSGVALAPGQTVTFSLDLASATAIKGVDFASLKPSSLIPAPGVELSSILTGAGGLITVVATNVGLTPLPLGSQLLKFNIKTKDNDSIVATGDPLESSSISDGDYLVGKGIPAGTYSGELAGSDSGYWQISTEPNGTISSIVANDNPTGPFLIEVSEGQYLRLRDVKIRLDSDVSASPSEGDIPFFEVRLASSSTVRNASVKTAIADDDGVTGVDVNGATPTQSGGLNIKAPANAGPVNLKGTNRGDVITGNNKSNQIYGGKGLDVMAGLSGSDLFRFRLSDGLNQDDQIIDFDPAKDKIELADVSRSSKLANLFNGRAEISPGKSNIVLAIVDSASAADRSSKQLVYNRSSGDLFYNRNGSKPGFGSGGQIATLPILINFNIANVTLSYENQAF